MVELTGDPKIDALVIKHAEEIKRLEEFGREKAAENEQLIAKIKGDAEKETGT